MKTSYFFLIIIGLCILSPLKGQNNGEIALSVNGKPVYLDELLKDYNNRGEAIAGEEETFQGFLDSYILKKLVLEEAIDQRIDTTEVFKREFRIYNLQLLDSFLKDTISSRELTNEIIDRFKYELELNHVFVPFGKKKLLPKDTLEAYQIALERRDIAIRKGFDKVKKGLDINSFGIIIDVNTETGYAGWVKPLMYPLEFDEIIFSLGIGEVTMPIKGETGYHIFQVLDKRPAQGTPIIEQVMFNFPVIPANAHIRDSVYKVAIKTYDEIAIRNNFQEICNEFATAFETGERGCLLGAISLGTTIPQSIIQASFELQNPGDISKPILSDYGYHILRLKDKLPAPTTEQIRQQVTGMLKQPSVLNAIIKKERQRLFKESNINLNSRAYSNLTSIANELSPIDSTFCTKPKNTSDILFSINKTVSYTVQDLLNYINANAWLYNQTPEEEEPSLAIVKYTPAVTHNLSTDALDNFLQEFMYVKALQYKKEMLIKNNSSYNTSSRKLSEGLMYTTLMDKEIWKKTKLDYEGLQKTFLKNKSKYKLDKERFKGIIIHSKDAETLDEIEKLYKKNSIGAKELKQKYNKETTIIQAEEGSWVQGDNEFVDTVIYKSAQKKAQRNFPHFTVLGQFITSPQDFTDVKAQVERDYQLDLETKWTAYLKKKYKVEINQAVIKDIK